MFQTNDYQVFYDKVCKILLAHLIVLLAHLLTLTLLVNIIKVAIKENSQIFSIVSVNLCKNEFPHKYFSGTLISGKRFLISQRGIK